MYRVVLKRTNAVTVHPEPHQENNVFVSSTTGCSHDACLKW